MTGGGGSVDANSHESVGASGDAEGAADADDARPQVLVIDDEERVGQAFALWLGDDYRVDTATNGEEGLEILTDDVDVVLLDRHMPGLSGTEVLERIREAGYDCRVAMVTAVDPDLDIVDLPFDDYVSKPVDRETLRDVIDRLLSLDRYDRRMGKLYAVGRTIATVEAEAAGSQLEDDDRYRALRERKAELEADTREVIESMDPAEVSRLFDIAVGDIGNGESGDGGIDGREGGEHAESTE